MTPQQLKRLGTKTKQVMAKNGLGGTGNQHFILYPEFDLLDMQSMDGLANNITVVEAEITFTIKQLDNNIIFNSEAITVTGDGNSKKQAITKAINQIKSNDRHLREFVEKSKVRLLGYYAEKCTSIINDATMLTETKQYLKAMSLLSSIPSEADCYDNAREKMLEVFLNYQDQNCSEWLLKAKSMEANNNYSGALSLLSKIDPLSSCGNEVSFLLKKIGKAVDQQDRRIWETLERRYSDQIALEEMRMEMTTTILTEYYQSKQSDHHQFILIR